MKITAWKRLRLGVYEIHFNEEKHEEFDSMSNYDLVKKRNKRK